MNLQRDFYYELNKPPPTTCKPKIPVEYVSSGYQVEPNESAKLEIKIISQNDPEIRISGKFEAKFGEVKLSKLPRNLDVRNLTVEEMNAGLAGAWYHPTKYDARKLVDIVKFTVEGDLNFTIEFPITIHWSKLPVLNHRTSDAVEDRVTVLTKTYLRYPCLRRFLKSVELFYPNITVIIADDNNDEDFRKMESEIIKIKQYRMPEKEGWFAGRALALSQDSILPLTDLRYMVNVAETTGYDLIGGSLNKHERSPWAKSDFMNIRPSPTGFCFHRGIYQHLELPGFEDECRIVDIMDNFFLGRTVTAGKIRFDPEFDNKGHKEYFFDARGQLRIAWCKKPMITHVNNCTPKEEWNEYRFGRTGGKYGSPKEYTNWLAELWYFRSHVKCMPEKP
ncbi:Oidioi.mRNA.OKI2018_I69.PAR.g8618.t1.cds [Oikopleura dioica]|uniref:Oidioi.mRNA.OKI2018_I69.PAR.g8618.t1.cds n=1 Tax=Oikopleura dioica TaxID=34765 RepID=A0ABN7RGT0_OIKDI|nr:Oidioi.mRNA.OKI2018_I69.PAR.g8618.t1.cds [Oikopleura dioica]